MGLVLFDQLRTLEQLVDTVCRLHLATMGANGVYGMEERLDSAIEGIEGHRGDEVGPL